MDRRSSKVHRVTFSRTLADHIVAKYHPEMEVVKMRFVRGSKLSPGEESRAAYAIVGTRKDVVLRIALRREVAEMYYDGEHRHLEEVFLVL